MFGFCCQRAPWVIGTPEQSSGITPVQSLALDKGCVLLQETISCDLACQTFVELKPLSTSSLLTGQSWQGLVYHRNYGKSEDAPLSHGASGHYQHKPCVK